MTKSSLRGWIAVVALVPVSVIGAMWWRTTHDVYVFVEDKTPKLQGDDCVTRRLSRLTGLGCPCSDPHAWPSAASKPEEHTTPVDERGRWVVYDHESGIQLACCVSDDAGAYRCGENCP